VDDGEPAPGLHDEREQVRPRRGGEDGRVGLGEGPPQLVRIEPARGEHGQHAERGEPGPARHPGEVDPGPLGRLERVHRHELEAGRAPAPGDLGDGRRRLIAARVEARSSTAVVEEQDLAAARLSARPLRDDLRARALGVPDPPRPADEPEAAAAQRAADERPLEAVRRAEERRGLYPCAAEGVPTTVQLVGDGPWAGEVQLAVRVPVQRDEVAAPDHLAHERRPLAGSRAQHEEGGLHPGQVEGVEDRRRVRPRPVVEGERHLAAIAAPLPQGGAGEIEAHPEGLQRPGSGEGGGGDHGQPGRRLPAGEEQRAGGEEA
jgi:hypothetical protein